MAPPPRWDGRSPYDLYGSGGPPGPPPPPPRPRRGGRIVAGAVAIVLVGVLAVSGTRLFTFLRSVANIDNPLQLLPVEPPAGSVPYKLKHGQQVNILALGYGGAENDAPYLTDSIMVISIDPANQRIVETSIPRDLYVRIDAWQDGRSYSDKINAAFEVPNQPKLFGPGPLKPEFQGRDGAGHLAEATVARLTGLTFDKYAAVDFRAFRGVVDDLGGVTVHMDSKLDDCHYPDYHDGYLNHGVPLGYRCPPGAGIHFAAGDYQVNGEQALEIARSRDAIEPEQANDFARSKRQQMIVSAIKRKATSASALPRIPQLMDTLQANFRTDMDVNDIRALYTFGSKLPESAIQHFAVTDQDLGVGFDPYTPGTCGPRAAYVLCPTDHTYRTWQLVFSHLFVPKPVLTEQAPLQLVNASRSFGDLQGRMTNVMRPLGFQVADGARHGPVAQSVIYDYSGGKYPQTAAWLQEFYGAQVEQGGAPAAGGRPTYYPAPGQRTDGLVVVMGSDFAGRFYGVS